MRFKIRQFLQLKGEVLFEEMFLAGSLGEHAICPDAESATIVAIVFQDEMVVRKEIG